LGTAGIIAMWAFVALLVLAWLVLLLMNVLRLVKVVRLDEEDKADNRGWIVWGLSVAGLFTGCCFAIVTWVVMEWLLKPLDPFEDSLGTIQLFGSARTNITFVIITNVIGLVVLGLGWGVKG